MRIRPLAELSVLLVDKPGLTDVQEWRQDIAAPTRLKITGAVGRKP
jgi:hypothetical protein